MQEAESRREIPCGFVRPSTSETEWWLPTTVTAALFAQVLAAFAGDVGAGPSSCIILALEGAGSHTGEAVQEPQDIHLLFPSAYSPASPPAEHVWPLANEPLANRRFDNLTATRRS